MTEEYALHLLNQLMIGASVDAKPVIPQYELAQALNVVIKALEQKPCEDCISRQKALDCFEQTNTRQGAKYAIETLPSVTPERPNLDMIKRIRKAIDEMTEIHSDGEFYIKNVDAKWIISKYLCGAKERPKGRWIATENEEMNIVGYYCSCCDLPMETEERTKYCPNCGAEMSGGEEDEDRKSL